MAAFIVFFYFYDNHRAYKLSQRLEYLKNELEKYRKWALSPRSYDRYDALPPILKSKISFNFNPIISDEIVNTYIREEIHKLLIGHKTLNYVFLSKLIRIKEYMKNNKLVLTITTIILVLFTTEWWMLYKDK